MSEAQRDASTEKQAWEHIAPELPPGWSVENSGDMDYQQNWATRAADGTVTERGFCGREYAVEDCWEQFGTPQKSWAELIAPGLVREAAAEAWGEHAKVAVEYGRDWVCIRVMGAPYQHAPIEHERPTICDAAWACIQALGGGE